MRQKTEQQKLRDARGWVGLTAIQCQADPAVPPVKNTFKTFQVISKHRVMKRLPQGYLHSLSVIQLCLLFSS